MQRETLTTNSMAKKTHNKKKMFHSRMTVEDMRKVAAFHRIIKNYRKMEIILSREEKEVIEKLTPHIDELRNKITQEEDTGVYPHDVVTTKQLKTIVEGIDIDICWEEYASRDGDEYDAQEISFTVNGVDYLNGTGLYAKRNTSKVREFFENEILSQ